MTLVELAAAFREEQGNDLALFIAYLCEHSNVFVKLHHDLKTVIAGLLIPGTSTAITLHIFDTVLSDAEKLSAALALMELKDSLQEMNNRSPVECEAACADSNRSLH